MAGYSGMILTKAGLQLQAQAQIGGELRITKIAIGDGILASGESVEDLTALKHQVMTLGIQDMQVTDDGQSRIRALITNDNLNTGFFVREVGVFAKIGDTGTETLYSYTNAGDKADYLPNKGLNIVEEVLEVYVIVGNAQNVTCNINDRVTLATKQDLSEHTTNTNNPHNTVASQIANTLISGLGTTDVQSTLAAIFKEATKKSGSMRNVVVTGPVSTSGMANVLRDRYSDNLCVGGTPLSGGDNGTYVIANAFDGNLATNWTASQTTANQANTSFIGYNFTVAKAICKLYVNQASALPMPCKLQYSDDYTAWTDSGAFTTYYGKNKLTATGTTAHKYWRLLATANLTTSSVWSIFEIEMYALLNPEFTDSDILIQANALVSFAAGFDLINKQPLDYWVLTQQMSLALAAADAYTVPLLYTDDLCNGGTPISGGDYTVNTKDYAFDNSLATASWTSNQMSANQLGAAYIGYNFGTAKAIRRIKINNYNIAVDNMPSVKVQYSNNGTSWTDAAVQTLDTTINAINYINVPAVGAYQYWRLLANANLTNSYGWALLEVEMYEALQTYYVYLTRDASGNVTVGSTRNKPKTAKPTGTVTTTSGYYTDDLCNGGTAISSGDYSGSSAANAYDNNVATSWNSAQLTPNLLGLAYIGYNFGIAKAIRKIMLNTHATYGYNVTSVKVQYSDNGTSWTDTVTVSQTYGINYITLPNVGTHQYWRILANSAGRIDGTTGNCWIVQEVEMYEYIEPITSTTQADDTTYSVNLCTGGAALSGGDRTNQSYSEAKENAFDGKNGYGGSWWSSSQLGSATTNAAYIGYDFGIARHIRKVDVKITSITTPPASGKIQRSTDGNSWTDVLNVSNLAIGDLSIYLPVSTPSRYWRLLATSASGGTEPFTVVEMAMYEISNDINLYDPTSGISKHYDGSTWDNVARVFVGEAVVDSAGNIVSYTTYPYNKSKLKALPAEDSDDVVTLGQFKKGGVSQNCWERSPTGLITQLFGTPSISAGASMVITLPITFETLNYVVMTNCGADAASPVASWSWVQLNPYSFKLWNRATVAASFSLLAIGY